MFKRKVIGGGIGCWRRPVSAALAVGGLLIAAPGASASPAFTQVSGSPFSTAPGALPRSVAFSPDGLLATANYNPSAFPKPFPATASVFSVGSGGALTQVNGSPFATGARGGLSAAFSPGGGLLAVTDLISPVLDAPSRVSVFSVGAGGALTPVSGSPFPTGASPSSVAFSPDGQLLATANQEDDSVSVFSVGPGGALTEVNGSPFGTGSGPGSVAFSPSGRLLATANACDTFACDSTVSVFSVGSDGALTPVGSPVPSGGNEPSSLAFSPSGGLLAVTNFGIGGTEPFDNRVSVFSVAPGGALTPVSGSPFTTGNGPLSVAFSPSGGLLATANFGDNTMSVFSVASNGGLTPLNGSPFATGSGPGSVAFSPAGGLLATANQNDSTVTLYRAFSPIVATGAASGVSTTSATLNGAVNPENLAGSFHFEYGTTTTYGSSTSSQTVAPGADPPESATISRLSPGTTYHYRIVATNAIGTSDGADMTLTTASPPAAPAATPAAAPAAVRAAAAKQLKLSVSPQSTVAGNRVCYSFKATSGRGGVSGVAIRFTGRTTHTSSHGTARICQTLSRQDTYTAHASKTGYSSATARVTVKAKPRPKPKPTFTG